MTSAQVLLGLAPTILALLGTSTEGAAMMAVVGRRPLFSLLLALGSPNVYFGRALDEYKPLAMLKTSARCFNAGSGRRRVLVNVLEYLRRRVRGGGQHGPAGLAAGRAHGLHVHGVPIRRSRRCFGACRSSPCICLAWVSGGAVAHAADQSWRGRDARGLVGEVGVWPHIICYNKKGSHFVILDLKVAHR